MTISLYKCISPLRREFWCSYCSVSSDSSRSAPLTQNSARGRCQPGSALSWPALHPGALSTGKPEMNRDFLLHLEVEKRPKKFSACHVNQKLSHAVSEMLCSYPHCPTPYSWAFCLFSKSCALSVLYWHNSYISPLAQSKENLLLVKREFIEDSAEVALYS